MSICSTYDELHVMSTHPIVIITHIFDIVTIYVNMFYISCELHVMSTHHIVIITHIFDIVTIYVYREDIYI